MNSAGGHASRVRLSFFQFGEALPLLARVIFFTHFCQCASQLIMRARVGGLQFNRAPKRDDRQLGVTFQQESFSQIVNRVRVLRI